MKYFILGCIYGLAIVGFFFTMGNWYWILRRIWEDKKQREIDRRNS